MSLLGALPKKLGESATISQDAPRRSGVFRDGGRLHAGISGSFSGQRLANGVNGHERRDGGHVMSWCQRKVMATCLVAWFGAGLEDGWAQDKPKEPPKLGWSNSTDLSLVVTAGNSAAQTWGFSDELRREWKNARFKFEVNFLRSDTSDDRFCLVAPGIEFPVGGAPVNPATSLSKPDP